jgi:hypothetical protein
VTARTCTSAPTAMNHFKALVDGMNHAEYRVPGYSPSELL